MAYDEELAGRAQDVLAEEGTAPMMMRGQPMRDRKTVTSPR
jgi:hypothetical protein